MSMLAALLGAGRALTGTENDKTITGSVAAGCAGGSSMADAGMTATGIPASGIDSVAGREVEIQRYIVGAATGRGGTDTLPSSSTSGVPAFVCEAGVRSSAVASALRLFRGRDCFFNRRLMVSI